MIVLCGIPSEPSLRLVIGAAERAGVDHLVVDQRDAHRWELRLVTGSNGLGGALSGGGAEHELSAVKGVYVRLTAPEELPEVRGHGRRPPDPRVAAKVLAFHTLLGMWLEGADCRVANRLSAGGPNVSKPYQAMLISAAGLAVPDTLVTNDPSAAERYAADHGEVVLESVSTVRSIVRRLEDDPARLLERVRSLPTQFQQRVPGTDVRVHVVGDTVLATEIASEAADHRYAGRDGQEAAFRAVTLPPDVEAACRRVASALQLPFCGIDLRRGPDGGYTCLEVNPSPGYSYYQARTGQPIAEALVAWLTG